MTILISIKNKQKNLEMEPKDEPIFIISYPQVPLK